MQGLSGMPTWVAMLLVTLVVLLAATLIIVLRKRPLPNEWPLASRPIMTADEQLLYERLRGLFPDYMVLAKVPLSRFMRLQSEANIEEWYALINPLHVSFVLCAPNRRVVTAIDTEGKHGRSAEAHVLKEKALQSCRIRYVTIPALEIWTDVQMRQMLLAEMPADHGPGTVDAAGFTMSQFGNEQPAVDAVRERLDSLRSARKSRSSWAQDSFLRGDSKL
jgi:hypothetical protein